LPATFSRCRDDWWSGALTPESESLITHEHLAEVNPSPSRRPRRRRAIFILAGILIGIPVLLMVTFVITTTILDRTNSTIHSSGMERRYLLYVPSTYDRARPTPLVISLHGAGMWPAQEMHMTHWNRLADEFGFIVVYPAARGRIWRVTNPGEELTQDVRFIADLVDSLSASYTIDSRRVYANGFSLGGAMTFVLSCAISDRLAAVGTVSAAQTLPWSWCTDQPPMPLINVHGTADLVPYEGGPSPDPFNPLTFPSVLEWTGQWAERNSCGTASTDSVVATDVRTTTYEGCADNASVVLYTILDGGHVWPGGKPLPSWIVGRTSQSIDATRRMWEFFQAHPRGTAAGELGVAR
jgi:polyhydroxybutyrate depolymerase